MKTDPLDIPPDTFWIGPPHPFDLHEVYVDFRAPSLNLDSVPESASLFMSADSRYRLWINGNLLARGPARCWPHAQSVDIIEIADHLVPGQNQITVQVYQPGYSHFSYVHQAAMGQIAWLILDDEVLLVSDTQWRVRTNASFSSQVKRISIYGSGVEDRDLRLDDDWQAVSYDDMRWEQARTVAPASGPLWSGLKRREVPFLVEEIRRLKPESDEAELLEIRSAPCAHSHDPHLDLKRAWEEGRRTPIDADDDGWFTVTLDAGISQIWLFDLGQDYTCVGRVEVDRAQGGELLWIGYQEKIRNGELVISDPDTYCRVRNTDRIRVGPGASEVESFSLRGGRYLLFGVSGPTFELRVRFGVRTARYPLELKQRTWQKESDLCNILDLCERTFHACLQETFVDAVWRESSQWLGDALPQSLVLTTLSDDLRPLRRVIEMAAEGIYSDGMLPSILPGEVHAYAVLDYCFVWVELLDLYRQHGDLQFIKSHSSTLKRMLARFSQDIGEDGLIRSQPGRRLFLDWSPMSRAEPNGLYNLRYVHGLRTGARLLDVLGEDGDGSADRWRRTAERLCQSARKTFWADGRWWDVPEQSTFSQTTAAFAILSGAADAGEVAQLLDAIVARSLDEDDDPKDGKMVLASPFMHHYIFEALATAGRYDEIEEIVRLRWGRWTRAGYPTCWENWNVDFPDGSQCHAFSAHPLYHLTKVKGR